VRLILASEGTLAGFGKFYTIKRATGTYLVMIIHLASVKATLTSDRSTTINNEAVQDFPDGKIFMNEFHRRQN
jgi:hypothetical protein